MEPMKERNKTSIGIIVLIVLVVVALGTYGIINRVDNFQETSRQEGYQACQNTIAQSIINEIQENGFLQIGMGGDQVLILAPVQPEPAESS